MRIETMTKTQELKILSKMKLSLIKTYKYGPRGGQIVNWEIVDCWLNIKDQFSSKREALDQLNRYAELETKGSI